MTQDRALSILQTGGNVFLTGAPGSGKTHVLRAYIDWLREHDIEPAVTASTGIAATHIQGMTIHAWSGVGVTERLTPYDLDRIMGREPVAKRIQKASVLIIDEISMLSGPILDMVDAICRGVRGRDEPFGGMQVVLVGDFFQLPPVSPRGTRVPFAFESRAWQSLHAITCYLTEQHRQDDESFLSLLQAIRAGRFAEDEAELLQERYAGGKDLPTDIPRLYTHNADVDRINVTQLASLPGKTRTFTMETSGNANLVEALKRGCLSPEKLVLKEDAVVMCTKNNSALGFANGTLAHVIGFDTDSGFPIIKLLDEREIVMAPADWVVEEDGKVRAKVSQVPLRLAWAITVHKSQGMSMDAAAMDLSRAFEFGQGYVALSRVRSLAGLHLLGWNSQALAIHPTVEKHDLSFQDASVAAEESFDELEQKGELAELSRNFVESSGGTYVVSEADKQEKKEKRKKALGPKTSTYDETFVLVETGKSLKEIAAARGLSTGTICSHLEKLAAGKRISREQLQAVLPSEIADHMDALESAFHTFGIDSLSPVFAHFDGQYSFDELKLARAFIATA